MLAAMRDRRRRRGLGAVNGAFARTIPASRRLQVASGGDCRRSNASG
jgi:hypothetical protein